MKIIIRFDLVIPFAFNQSRFFIKSDGMRRKAGALR